MMTKRELIKRLQEAYDYLSQDPVKWREEIPYADKVSDFYPYACGYVACSLKLILEELI